MELPNFQNLLIELNAPGLYQAATSIIEDLKSNKYPEYILLLLNTIQQYINEQVFNTSITLLYIEIKKKTIFEYSDLAIQAVSVLTPIIANILQSPVAQENFKDLLSYILAQLHIFVYNLSNNVEIPTYLLVAYNEKPEIRKFVIYCIFSIVIGDPRFGGFSVEDLMSIIVNTGNDEKLYMHRFKLLLAMAIQKPDIPSLQELLPPFISTCPPYYINDMLLSLSDFAEKCSLFFLPFLEPLVKYLCDISINREFDKSIRNKAIICLASIAEGAPEMCQSTEAFYNPTFKTLIMIAAEITDDSPMELDSINDEPYQTSIDAMGLILEKFDDLNFFNPIYEMTMLILSEPTVQWQQAYAAISCLSEVNIFKMSFMEVGEIIQDLFTNLVNFMNLECHPRVRMAIYSLISNLSKNSILPPYLGESQLLISPLIQLMVEENVLICKKMAYIAFTDFVSQVSTIKSNQYLERLFPSLIEDLHSQELPDDFKILIIRLLGPLIKFAGEDSINYFQPIFKITFMIIKTTREPNIQAETIYCFALTVTSIPHLKRLIDPKTFITIIRLGKLFINQGIPLLNVIELEKTTVDHLYDAIFRLIIFLEKYALPFIPLILPKTLEDSQKDISIEQIDSFEANDIFNTKTLYKRIPSIDQNIKLYANKSEVSEVKRALYLLDAIIFSDPNFQNYINPVYDIINKWIINKFIIKSIQEKCWSILETLLILHKRRYSELKNNPEMQSTLELQAEFNQIGISSVRLIEIIFHCYIYSCENNFSSPLYLQKILKVAKTAISFGKSLGWCNPNIFASLLSTLQPLIDNIIQMKAKKIKDMAEFSTVDLQNKSLADYDNCLFWITELILKCFKFQPQITSDFYASVISPKTEEYLSNDLTLIFGINVTTIFIIHTKDVPKMIEFANSLIKYTYCFDRQDDLVIMALSSLGNLFYEIPIGNPEIANNFFEYFNSYFQQEQLIESKDDNFLLISDYANVAFAKFLHSNKNLFDPEQVLSAFLDAKPLWQNPNDSDYYYRFVADIMALGWFTLYMPNDWPDEILGQIITGFVMEQYKDETRKIFAETFINLLKDPFQNAQINRVLNAISGERKKFFFKLIDF